MNLHYSQTLRLSSLPIIASYTSMNLHYSQTPVQQWISYHRLIPLWIYITLKLVYVYIIIYSCLIPLWIYITLKPVTSASVVLYGLIPLWIYITLKPTDFANKAKQVLYLYEFTLLSNLVLRSSKSFAVLYLYEFTLLSNQGKLHSGASQSYTSMNLHYSQTYIILFADWISLIPLWIYITLKPR